MRRPLGREELAITTQRSLRWLAPPAMILLAAGVAEARCNPGISCTAGPGEVLELPNATYPSLSYTANSAQALTAQGVGASVTANGISFSAPRETIIAGSTTLPGTIILNGGSAIMTSGNGGSAAISQRGQGLLIATDIAVQAGGSPGDAGIRHNASAVNDMTLTRVQVTISAAGVAGLDADSPTASLIANDVVITTTGDNAEGVEGDGRLTMTGGSVTTFGSSSHGLFASGATPTLPPRASPSRPLDRRATAQSLRAGHASP